MAVSYGCLKLPDPSTMPHVWGPVFRPGSEVAPSWDKDNYTVVGRVRVSAIDSRRTEATYSQVGSRSSGRLAYHSLESARSGRIEGGVGYEAVAQR